MAGSLVISFNFKHANLKDDLPADRRARQLGRLAHADAHQPRLRCHPDRRVRRTGMDRGFRPGRDARPQCAQLALRVLGY